MDPTKLDPRNIEAVDNATRNLTELLIRYGPRTVTALIVLVFGLIYLLLGLLAQTHKVIIHCLIT